MRTRIQLSYDATPGFSIKRFKAEMAKGGENYDAYLYGLALAQLDARQLDAARLSAHELLKRHPNKTVFVILAAEIDAADGYHLRAAQELHKHLLLSPNNHPLTMAYATALTRHGNYKRAAHVLEKHTLERPLDPLVWYDLAEVAGLAQDIVAVHKARAEYFILTGALDQAQRQLGYALNLVRENYHESARIRARKSDIQKMREELEEL